MGIFNDLVESFGDACQHALDTVRHEGGWMTPEESAKFEKKRDEEFNNDIKFEELKRKNS